jgi:hypothetical protein
MADSFIQLATDGTGKKLDTRTDATNAEHRQVVVLGDPSSNTGVAPVDVANGLAVQIIPQLPAGANTIGNVGSAAVTSGGNSIYHLKSAATTNAQVPKASAGQVYGWSIFNQTASVKYVKFYNKASAPTVGTDVPVFVIPLESNFKTNSYNVDAGITFSTGIAIAITAGLADSDATAIAASDVVVNLFYK